MTASRRAAVAVAFAALLPAGAGLAALAFAPVALATTWTAFSHPQPVAISGYPGSAEEPFISPDGRYLLFNSSEAEPDFTLQYARATGAGAFEYAGPIAGEEVDYPGSLSGTPTLDDEGNLYWISNRAYAGTRSTVFSGHFNEGFVTGVNLVEGVVAPEFGLVDFDVGVSPSGRFLYVALGKFGASGPPTSAALVMFERNGAGFVPYGAGKAMLVYVNKTAALVYGAAVTPDELEIFYTAASPAEGREPQIYRARRTSTGARFTHIERVAAITGFAEAPSISSDGTTLYYHEKVGEEVRIQTVTRIADLPAVASVSPRYGPAAGGTLITVKGSYLNGASAVDVGGVPATEVNIVSAAELTARTPPGAPGIDDVTVTTAQGTSATSAKDHFTYR